MPRTPLVLSLAALMAAPASAQFFGGGEPPAEARLLAGWETAPGARAAGLAISLAPGWKTYWRQPGEAGIPPVFDWSASENLASAEVVWPAPELFESFGLATLGYAGEVVLPLRLTAADPERAMRVRLTLDYGLCAEICVPARAELALDLAPGAAADGRAAIEAAAARRPIEAAEAGLAEASCALVGAGMERGFEARLAFDGAAPKAVFLAVEGPEGVSVGAAALDRDGAAISAAATAQVWDDPGWIGRDAFDLTLIGEGWAIDLPKCGQGG